MKIKVATITGADDSVQPESLIELSKEFPFVEWGILLSESSTGRPRSPSREWIFRLSELYFADSLLNLNLSAHLCGKWVRQLLKAEGYDFAVFLGNATYMFQRYQINTHAKAHQVNRGFRNLTQTILRNKQVIIQFDGVNECLYDLLKGWGVKVVPLFDLSGGAGIVPMEWAKPIGEYCGYAGGHGPDNLEEQLQKIEKVVGNKTIWVDMETKVRSDNDTLFDLKKVRKCLGITQLYMKEKKIE